MLSCDAYLMTYTLTMQAMDQGVVSEAVARPLLQSMDTPSDTPVRRVERGGGNFDFPGQANSNAPKVAYWLIRVFLWLAGVT